MAKPLNPKCIPKYVNQLPIPPVFKPTIVKDPITGEDISHNYTVTMTEFMQQILPPMFPQTTVWGYEGNVEDLCTGEVSCFRSSPGATFETIRGIPANVQWINNITEPNLFAVDPTLHWANPNNIPTPTPPFLPFPPGYTLAQNPVPLVTHLHGAEVRSDSDGGPDAWFTAGEENKGSAFLKSRYTYPNTQEPTTLWYHDHALGTTRLGVYAGLAGFYLIKDPNNKISPLLPSGLYEIPIVIQDRSFNKDGSLFFPSNGVNPDVHPYWRPAFVGNAITVNGKVWPNLNVERRQYRFRLLNGSNTRTYNLKLSNEQPFIQIGSDGGFLPFPVTLNELLIAPGERADILIDFSILDPETTIIMTNDANAPFPNGRAPDPDTVGQIMQFTILDTPVVPPTKLPAKLNKIPVLTPDEQKKILTLNVVRGPNGALELLLDGQTWGAPISELPIVGSTVEWEIVNLTNGAHPIHIHLIQFQVANRQNFDNVAYREEWIKLNGEPPLNHPTVPLPVDPFLEGSPIDPPLNERGWKDTVIMLPGEVTRLKLRFAPQDADPKKVNPGVNLFPFDPTFGPGYVWHCHILDHEDNEMMRPLKVTSCPIPVANPQSCCQVMVEGSTQLVPPALKDSLIVHKNTVYAEIERVCPENVLITGFIRRTISYTAALDNGIEQEKEIVDDTPFQCVIDRDDANEGDEFRIVGSTILCEVFAHTQNFGTQPITNEPLAYKFVEKDIVKVCIRKGCVEIPTK
ncbi:multicopper oxidase family protein [Tepidibacter aestuarii]|uniref:multicopper oxidase family protein n=1 Tax=Tepidibacter aestuarii TaxID=2925782 RepID=UPI002DD637EC|nr:multicopper oxidase [Tepidibacter aestuarii]CAH2213111.1 spore coat protein A, manganese oxidase [Tepidibacter aestuarii]